MTEPRARKNLGASERKPARVAFVNELNVRECAPKIQWRVRLMQMQLTDKHEIEIRFRTRDRKWRSLRVDDGSRSDYDKVRRDLESYNARLPNDKTQAIEFVKALIRQTPTQSVIACASPGFRNGATGFVMPHKVYGSARVQFIWDPNDTRTDFGAIQGDLESYARGVLEPALRSPYLDRRRLILARVRAFDQFNEDNDPHGEHDFGVVDEGDVRCMWKIDYYDRDMELMSPDPADPSVTTRVLTLMLAEEY